MKNKTIKTILRRVALRSESTLEPLEPIQTDFTPPPHIDTSQMSYKDKLRIWRNGGSGFIQWCEDNVNLAIYEEGSDIPKWIPMGAMPQKKNPITNRSYQDCWDMQKPILMEALQMHKGRFKYRLIVLCWMRGDGKCERKGTEVILFDGSIKKVEDIRVGDYLMGDDNTPRKVLSLVNGKEEMFEVVPYRGESLFVTADHQLTLQKRAQMKFRKGVHYREPGHGDVIDISVKDFMNKSKGFQNSHMLFKVPLEFPHKEVPLDPYFLGLWLGDGDSNRPAITTMDPEVVEYIYEFAAKHKLEVTVGQKGKASSYALVTPKGKKNHLLDLMSDMGLIGNKHVPDVYRVNSKEVQMQLLCGILDSDGSRNRNSFDLTLKKENIIDSIAFIARSLGFFVVKNQITKGIKSTGFEGTYYRLGISGDCSQIPVRVEKKKCSPRMNRKNILLTTIKEIRSIGEDEYYGFTLDGNGRYVRSDFTVTHNSLIACLVQLWKFFCFPKQQIMLGANSKDQVKFVHYDIMREIILNSPNLLRLVGERNIQEKEIRLQNSRGVTISMIRSISSFSGIVSNITGYTFSEIFDMKNPKFFVQLDGSTRNMPNALGIIDSTVSAKTHILYKLYQSWLENKHKSMTFFSYRSSKLGSYKDFFNPQMTQAQLDDYRMKFPPAEFDRYFRNVWESGVGKVFSEEMLVASRILSVHPSGRPMPNSSVIQTHLGRVKQLQETNETMPQVEQLDQISVMKGQIKRVDSIFSLADAKFFHSTASIENLKELSDYYDTDWSIGIGVDRADPLKNVTHGARTIVSIVAKGLPGSRSNTSAQYMPNAIHSYIYVLLGLNHVVDNTLYGIKEILGLANHKFDGLDMFCSERWGMFDIIPWLEDNEIRYELIQPNVERQKMAFSELFTIFASERFKAPPIGVPGSKMDDIYYEEFSTLEQSTNDKLWYGSPEKSDRFGIQDDAVFSIVWNIYGMRNITVNDFRSRGVASFATMYYENKNVLGNYSRGM